MRPAMLLLVAAAGCAHAPATAPASSKSAEEIIARALPSVVLLVFKTPEGKTGFGSGVVITHDGLVLTNRHLLGEPGSLRAMLYAPDLVSYTPMDGGLDRFLFENKYRLVDAELQRSDPETDLALIRIAADTSKVPLLPLATGLPRQGEKVFVLGHPRETVWSFSQGVVSAIHHGAIQHDAAINPGSSGGPLLNERGELIGLNTSRLFGDTNGVGFARPIEMARWLIEGGSQPFELDRSTPERAASSCIRAQELNSPHLGDCFDWEARWQLVNASAATLPSDVVPAVLQVLHAEGRERWERRSRDQLLDFLRDGTVPKPAEGKGKPPPPPSVRGWLTPDPNELAKRVERMEKANGLTLKLQDPKAVRQALHKGVRLDASVRVKPELAWVTLVGRNPDGTEYRFSEAWALQADGSWLQHWPATAQELELLPKAYAPPLDLPDEAVRRFQVALLQRTFDAP